jgi:hypothetical protein
MLSLFTTAWIRYRGSGLLSRGPCDEGFAKKTNHA